MGRHAADLVRLLRTQGRLGDTTDELRARMLAWGSSPPDLGEVEMELARTIYLREPATENMQCPPAWRDAFEAGDELRAAYADVPDGTLARWYAERLEAEAEERDEVSQETADEAAGYGITDALMWRAIGPDAGEILDELRGVRLRDVLADVYYGERGYEVARLTVLDCYIEGFEDENDFSTASREDMRY